MIKYKCTRCGGEWGLGWGESHSCREELTHTSKRGVFTLNFDEPPALVFVQERTGTAMGKKIKVYQDGKEVHGVRAIDINASIDDVTTHTIEYATGCTKVE